MGLRVGPPGPFGGIGAVGQLRADRFYRTRLAESRTVARRPHCSSTKSRKPTRSGDAYLWLYLATVDAALGRRTEAIEEAARGTALHPPERDAAIGPLLVVMQARLLAWLGQREEAIELLRSQAAKPNGPPPGYLRRHPDWDVLRGEPRFEALVASLVSKASELEK